jgi:parallel beta-helix repeat protein
VNGCRLRLEALEPRMVLSTPPTLVVHPGDSIQAAVDAAPSSGGAIIDIEPGLYQQSVHVNKPGIAIIGLSGLGGAGGVVLQNLADGSLDTGITVQGVTGFVLSNVTIRGFAHNGVVLNNVDGFAIAGVKAVNDGDYGIFPEFSAHGVIAATTASGHSDTGIYVGQSHDVVISANVANGNVVGIEIENSSRVVAAANHVFDNTAGILVDLLPGLSVSVAADNIVAGNFVHDNNHANFATLGDPAALLPAGTGILVLGADRTSVVGNAVLDNQFAGIAVASSTFITQLGGPPVTGIDPNPDGTLVAFNAALGNGTNPPLPVLVGGDLVWDGTGTGNHWRHNLFLVSAWPQSPLPLPS